MLRIKRILFVIIFCCPSFLAMGQKQSDFSIWVDGACGMCTERIEKAAMSVAGVKKVRWEVETRMLNLEVDNPSNFDEMQVHYAVTGEGHDTKKLLAPESVYSSLPGCCQYRSFSSELGNSSATIRGRIVEKMEDDTYMPLIGVNIYWEGKETGAVSDLDGHFELGRLPDSRFLIFSYTGYEPLRIDANGKDQMEVELKEGVLLEAVEVVHRKQSTEISMLSAAKVQQINRGELQKAACCNLSESFETTPSVDVSFTDAVTGTRQIQLLGLAGPYVQMTQENMPGIRGIAGIYGMGLTPGPWIESIQLAKGPGSVVNGFESMTGQINLELKKPQVGEQFYLNVYGNQGGRMELNSNWRHEINKKLSTGLLIHASTLQKLNDRNQDGFLDMPLTEEILLLNRWKWKLNRGWEGQFGIKASYLKKSGGQLSVYDDANLSPVGWGSVLKSRRLSGWLKTGRVFPERPYASMGFQLAGSLHQQDAYFGERQYDALHHSGYANFIYQDIIGTTAHELKTGASFQYDLVEEVLGTDNFRRKETVPGIFGEYSWKPSEKVSLVAGLRSDYHNNYGFFVSPRLHLRIAPQLDNSIRLSFGSGRRTASVIAENIGTLASNRAFVFPSLSNNGLPYGMKQEVSWNAGLNWTKEWSSETRPVIFSVDLYHTSFSQQIVVDLENAREIRFYNLQGKSWSNSFQTQLDVTPLEGLDLRLAYRLNDVQVDYEQGRLERPWVAKHRSFINIAYETKSNWKFDFTLNWQGSRRIPDTRMNESNYQLPERSPDYFLAYAQLSKSWKNNLDVYVGVENLFNFVQENPILAADMPEGSYFDASMVWGPIFGRMIYAGMRYQIN